MLDDTTTQNLPAKIRPLSDMVAEYEYKIANVPALVAAFDKARADAEMGATVGGRFVGTIWDRYTPGLSESTITRNLLQSARRHAYDELNLAKIAPASDRSRFDLALSDPAPFTLDNIRATFGKYITDPRAHILRGLAEVFAGLDPAFKSHDKMKIGVKGLPKRVILSSVGDYNGWGTERIKDTINAIRTLNGLPHVEWAELSPLLKSALRSEGLIDGLTLRRFGNGNGHLFFDPATLLQVNKALAEYYGEVLPDCPEAAPKATKSTAVAKDLQFYRTPDTVADELVERAYPCDGASILEPSCGDGAILDALRRFADKKRLTLRALGIEVDPGRAAQTRAKGYPVQVANFLQVAPDPRFDYVLMNPPFYGKHYQQHVEHARKFLKPGGTLVAILPITAVTDHGYIEPGRGYDCWRDLPVGSFSESGTNINTGLATFHAPRGAA